MNDAERFDHDIASLQQCLGVPIPDELRRLFRQGGLESGPGRLMGPGEVASDYAAVRESGIDWRECCPIWTDDNSNYGALYLTGPLAGKVCLLDHEETDFSPAYRTLSSFLTALDVAGKEGKDWYEMPTDYPIPTDYYIHQNGRPTPATESELAHDREIVAVLRSRLAHLPSTEEDERRYLCHCIIGLTPPEDQQAVLGFLEDKDMWIQERATNVVGFRRFEPAVPQLANMALHGRGNGVIAAINALGRIGTPDCREALLGCLSVRAAYAPYLGAALKSCGCEATHDRGKWRYRLPGDDSWKAIN